MCYMFGVTMAENVILIQPTLGGVSNVSQSPAVLSDQMTILYMKKR